MPTSGRRRFVPRAIHYFLRQTYEPRELVILDDGPDPIADLIPPDLRIRYLPLGGRARKLGTKRNLACEEARGEILVHWDDDDWIADWRLARQVTELVGTGADACGLDRLLFLDAARRTAWQYVYSGSRRPWLAGGTLCYTRDAWRRHPFPEVRAGEDTRFVWSRAVRTAVAIPDPSFYVALIHDGNTSPKRTRGKPWRSHPIERVREIMGDDWSFYTGRPVPTAAQFAAQSAAQPAAQSAVHAARPPRLSLVLPAHPSGAPLLERTLLALAGQTHDPATFEVVVAADGGDPTGALASIIAADRPFRCDLVDVPRPLGDVPHRNHARNAGCRAAAGELLWIMDADFILPPHAIAHALAEHDRLRARGVVPVVSPCLAGMREPASKWLEATAQAVEAGRADALLAHASSRRIRPDQYSGFAEQHRPGGPSSRHWPALLEGFPIVPRAIWEALGGFDESFVGWGGNKEEFVRRLVALDHRGVVQVRLLHSVLALHQPHPPDPHKAGHGHARRQNQQRFRRVLEDLRSDAPWWREQRARAVRAVPAAPSHRTRSNRQARSNRHARSSRQAQPGRPASASRPGPAGRGAERALRVGILTVNDPKKGLWRDAETLTWALRGPPLRRAASRPIDLSVFPVRTLQTDVERDPRRATAAGVTVATPGTVPAGTRLPDWVGRLDVLIACEVWLPRTFALARRAGPRCVFIPNLDWANLGGDTEAWVRAVRDTPVEVWAKTEHARTTLERLGVQCSHLPWSIPDPVRRERTARDEGALRFLMTAGMGGWKNRRGVDIALEAFARARQAEPDLELVLHSIRPVAEYVGAAPVDTPGLRVLEGLLPRDRLLALFDDADAVLYPSRFDGFGISLLEALHAGLPVLATDGEPMRELVEHEHNGLLVHADRAGDVRLTPAWECSVDHLAEAMLRLRRDPELTHRLTCPEPGTLIARQRAFRMNARALVAAEPPPRIVLFHDDRPGDGSRRAELFWADALREHGYAVECLGYGVAASVRQRALRGRPDWVAVGKAPVTLLQAIRQDTDAPIVMWHHDLCDASPGRLAWFREVAPLCDLVGVPDEAARLVPEGRIVHLLPGPKTDGDRGPGRRPSYCSMSPGSRSIVFLGRATPDRVALLRALRERYEVQVYGDPPAWRAAGFECDGPRWGASADRVIREAGIVVSSSARHDLRYTSNRLFNSAAAGGCLLVRAFPGLETLYPAGSVVTHTSPSDAVAAADALLGDPERRRALKIRAEEHTFRHHTWLDRVGDLLDHLSRIDPVASPRPRPAPADAGPVPGRHRSPVPAQVVFWNDRAQVRGTLSVGHHKWGLEEFRRHTDRCWTTLARALDARRGADDRRLLDFGCGAGRFASRLAAAGFDVTGADIAPALLDLARAECRNGGPRLVRIGPAAPLPFRDSAFDVLWISLTLQHVPDADFGGLTGELRRVVRPGGLVALFENTFRPPRRTSRTGHMVFRKPEEYAAAFRGVELVASLDIEGEEHSVLVGRLQP